MCSSGLTSSKDFLPNKCFSLAVLAGPRSGLSSRPLLHCINAFLICPNTVPPSFQMTGIRRGSRSIINTTCQYLHGHIAVPPIWNKLPPVLRHISVPSYELTQTSPLAISPQLFHSKIKTLLFDKSYPDSSSFTYLTPRLNSKHHPP